VLIAVLLNIEPCNTEGWGAGNLTDHILYVYVTYKGETFGHFGCGVSAYKRAVGTLCY